MSAVDSAHTPEILARHLRDWLGGWPPSGSGVTVVGSAHRATPGWDGLVHDVVGVSTPSHAVLSVPLDKVDAVAELVAGDDLEADIASLSAGMGAVLGRPGVLSRGLFRWTLDPTDIPDAGEWVPMEDPRVPDWLKPFNSDVLIAWDDDGKYGAGVGRKMHDDFGHELSVVTEEPLRGRGIGRALVATAARRVIAEGRVPTYLHAPDNYASAKVADAAGFPDVGWRILGFWR